MNFKKANVNIALLKYWGKIDQSINLPAQTSISVTASNFYTLTNITLDPSLTKDKVFLDGKELTSLQYSRVISHLDTLRAHFKRSEHCIVTSYNNVYIRAGFASSASSFAALTAAYVEAIGAKVTQKELSKLARLGSGSAARSIHGGFVIWHKGEDHDTSFAEKLPITWPELRMIFTIIDSGIKPLSSRVGMQLCVEKAKSFAQFAAQSNALVEPMISALTAKDIDEVGELSEQSAELMRNVMLEAGIEYHTPATQKLINTILSIREQHNIPVYYTFDAGPNLILLTTEAYVDKVLALLPNVKTEIGMVGGAISDEVA